MYIKSILKFEFLATVTCSGANEVLSPCGNDGCQRSCTRLDVTGCTGVCIATGCVCVDGFVRNADGICVLPSTCRKYCILF